MQLLEALALELLDLLTQRLGIHLGRGLPHDWASDIDWKAQDHDVRIGRIAADLHVKRPLHSDSVVRSGLAVAVAFRTLQSPRQYVPNPVVQLLAKVVALPLQHLKT